MHYDFPPNLEARKCAIISLQDLVAWVLNADSPHCKKVSDGSDTNIPLSKLEYDYGKNARKY